MKTLKGVICYRDTDGNFYRKRVELYADAEPQETRKIAERGASVAFAPIMQTDAFKRYMDGLKAAGVSALT